MLPASGLIFLNAADPLANKETAPNGAYQDAGWQHLVRFKNFQGTMISPKHFITAAHLGSASIVTQPSYFNGVEDRNFTIKPNSQTIVQVGGNNSDLSIFEIWETFSDHALLYSSTNEVGKEFVITGKGRGRGPAIVRNGETVGWEWGDTSTEADRWGVSTILASRTTSRGVDLIYSHFDANGGPLECQATGNDSGGGWFIKDGADWKLAAVTFSADATRDSNDTAGDSSNFRGAMTKARGFYVGSDSNGWSQIPTSNLSYFNPSSFEKNTSDLRFYDKTHSYGTRISSFLPDLNALIQPSISNAALTPPNRFVAWLSAQGVTNETAPLDDADADGVANLLEYFAGSSAGDEADTRNPLTISRLPNGILQFSIQESLDLAGRGLTSILQQSPDLSNWLPVTAATESSNNIDAATGTRSKIIDLAQPADTRLFYRLEVTLAD